MRLSSITLFLKTKLPLAVLAVLIVWLSVGVLRAWDNKKSLETQLAALERTKRELALRNQDVAEELQDLQDPEFIEREARRKFNYQREGETVVVFVPPPSSSTISLGEIKEPSFFTKFGNWLRVIFTRD